MTQGKRLYYTFDCWHFGLYDLEQRPIRTGLKIVPNFPLNLFGGTGRTDGAKFVAQTKLARIGRSDFWDEHARFLGEQ